VEIPTRAASLKHVASTPSSGTAITTANPASMRAARASNPGWQGRYARSLALTDLIAIVAAVGIAQWVRFGSGSGNATVAFMRNVTYTEVSATIVIGWLVALTVNGARSIRIIGSGVEEFRRVWWATISVFGTVAIISMLFKLELARGYLMVALPLGVIGLLVSRWVARRVVVRMRKRHGRCVTRLLVVGSPQAVRELTLGLSREPWAGYEVVGACIPGHYNRPDVGTPGIGSVTVPILGDETSVARAVVASGSHAVAVAATEHFHGTGLRELSWELENLDVDLLVAPGVVDVAGPRLHMRPVAGLPLIHVEKPQYNGAKQFQKRAFDIAFSGLVLLIGLPLLLLIALAVKLTSRGPVFYRHERIGLDGEPFKMIKFRTMVLGADTMAEKLAELNLDASPRDPFKFINDPRVTKIGGFLRKYSLDELPQFINVFKRDMSVVGPRPQVRSEVDSYDDQTMRRLLVKPGITGLWQVSGRSDLSWEDSVRLDLFYVENWSIMADVVIALKTVRVVVNHSGSY